MNEQDLIAQGVAPELAKTLAGQFTEQSDTITKLNQVKENLFDDKAKWKTQNEEALAEAQRIKTDALKQAGDIETLEANWNAERQAIQDGFNEKLGARDKIILGGKKEAVINDLAGQFIEPSIGKMMLDSLVTTNYGEDGSVQVTVKGLDGQPITTDSSKFAETVGSMPQFASLLKGIDASGGGATGGSNNSGAITGKTQVEINRANRRKQLGLI